ncbi:MAG: hypothetical protein J0M08_06370 [Bacteroidetes bacterium]|nr:hypothetical protein [Bacteroidota bacterium]
MAEKNIHNTKLHLGCGQVYLDGYVNIDYPSSEHTVMTSMKADKYCNIKELAYTNSSIDEIRLHHVFEHFSRAEACALLSNWYFWLKPQGILHIEVPDFEKMAKIAISRFKKPKEKFVALRHIFGSHEAGWAIHYEGYSVKLLTQLLNQFGYDIKKVIKTSYQLTHNIQLIAEKKDCSLTNLQLCQKAKEWLSNYMVNEAESEKVMLEVWMTEYKKLLNHPI